VVYETVKLHELDDWDPHLPSCPPHNPLFPIKQLTDILSQNGIEVRERELQETLSSSKLDRSANVVGISPISTL
jgi:hypothetical protein